MDGRSDSGGDEPVKQVVLRHFQLAHLSEQLIAMTTHCLGMTLGLVVFLLGEGRLRDQGPKAGLIGIVSKMGKLFLRNAKITIDRLEAVRNVAKTPFDQGAAHGNSLGPNLPVPPPPPAIHRKVKPTAAAATRATMGRCHPQPPPT